MASQTIESTIGQRAGEVRLSHVLVKIPAGARRCDESSKAPGAKGGKAMVEMGAGEVGSLNNPSCTVPSLPLASAHNPNAYLLTRLSRQHPPHAQLQSNSSTPASRLEPRIQTRKKRRSRLRNNQPRFLSSYRPRPLQHQRRTRPRTR